jgi:phospholipase C
MGATDPNRLYTMAASIDPDGMNGGPLLQTLIINRPSFYGRLTYTAMPEQLQARGISWKVYSSADAKLLNGVFSNNVLSYFKNFQDPASVLYRNAFGSHFLSDFLADASSGNLPQVSWVIPPVFTSDHPPSPSLFGETILSTIITALTANSAQWAKTVIFATYDENGGFSTMSHRLQLLLGRRANTSPHRHFLNPMAVGNPAILGPIGLGFRVPMLIISPFSRHTLARHKVRHFGTKARFKESKHGSDRRDPMIQKHPA